MSEFEEQNREALAEWNRYVEEFRESRSDPNELPMVFSEWQEKVWEPLQADPLAEALSNVPTDLRAQEEFVRQRLPEAFLRSRHLEDERHRKLTGEPSQSYDDFCTGLNQELRDNPEGLRQEFMDLIPNYDSATAHVQGQIAEREGAAARAVIKALKPVHGRMAFDSTSQDATQAAIREAAFDDNPAETAPAKVVRALTEADVDAMVEVVDDLPDDLQQAAFLKEDVPSVEQQRLDAMSMDELDTLMDEDSEKAWEVMHGPSVKPAPAPSKPLSEMSLDELDKVLDGSAE